MKSYNEVTINDIQGTNSNLDMKIFKRASKFLNSEDICNIKTIQLKLTQKRKSKFLPKRSRTILPTTSLLELKNQRKIFALLSFLLSVIIIIGSIYECTNNIDQNPAIPYPNNITRIGLIGLSIFEIIIAIAYTWNALKVKVSYKMISKFSSVYQDRDLLLRLIIEILICMIIIPPYYTYRIEIYQLSIKQVITLDDLLLGLIFLRVIHLYKLYFEFSFYNSLKSKFYCDLLQIHDNFKFTMRCFMKSKPYVSVMIMLGLSPLLFGTLLYLFERSVDHSPFTYIWNGFWLVSYTQSTIGYGEMTPTTHLGRLSIILASFLGLFMYSYITLIVRNTITLSHSQAKLYSQVKYSKVGVNKLIKSATLLIQSWWTLKMKRRVRTSTINDVFKFNSLLTSFSFQRLKEMQLINPTLNEEVKRISVIPIKRMQNIINFLLPLSGSSLTAVRAANKQHAIMYKLKKLNKRLRKIGHSLIDNFDSNKLSVVNNLKRNSSGTSKALLKKLRGEAVKKMIKNRIEKTSFSAVHSSASSDDDFYSSRRS